MPEKMTFLNKKEILTFEEMYRLCVGFIKAGIRKIRITGGEPLVRKGIMDLFEMLKPHLSNDLEELTLTTNGTQLQKYASELYANGVRRINVSLDTLDPINLAHQGLGNSKKYYQELMRQKIQI